jgi:hypothetical protein
MLKWAYLLLVLAAATVGSRMIADLATPSEFTASATGLNPSAADSASSTDQARSLESDAAFEDSADPSARELLDPDIARRLKELRQQREQTEAGGLATSGATGDSSSNETPEVFPTETSFRHDSSNSDSNGPFASDVASANRANLPPIRQQSPLHDQMLTPGNFEYLGAFRLPLTDSRGSRFSYGGIGLTFRADGDANGPDDGFRGSLFMVGHRQEQRVAEFSVPKPVISDRKVIDELPVAEVLQPLSDITGGIRQRLSGDSSEPFEIGGLQVVGDRLHWTIFKYYNVTSVDYFSHGASSLDLSNPQPRGLWHLGPARSGDPRWHSYKHAGYICEVPEPFATQYLGGRNLMSGLQISTGRQMSSQGPALFAYRLQEQLPRNGASLDALPLLWYPMNRMVNRHHAADLWRGAAWLTVGNKQAVVVVGRKALGPERYGDALPTDCYDYKGYHGSAYEIQLLFYAPGNLVAASKKATAAVQPWYRWDASTPGGGIDRFMYQNCGREVGGLAYDRANQLVYISEVEAGRLADNEWELLPIIHTFRLVD